MNIFEEEDISVHQFIDKKCDWTPDHVERLIELAQHCGKSKKNKRPDMNEVLPKLQVMYAELNQSN